MTIPYSYTWREVVELFDTQLRAVEDTLLPRAKRLTGDMADAEDLTQETFLWMLRWVRPPYREEDIQASFFRFLGLGIFFPPTEFEVEEAERRTGLLLKLLAGEPLAVRWALRIQFDVWSEMDWKGYFSRSGRWLEKRGIVTNTYPELGTDLGNERTMA